jgi:ABC-type uncharacterized transport system involved in gliding motility auxiliary subunit
VEGVKPMAKWLALGGLLLAALGGLFYALSMQNPHYGLIAAAVGLALVAAGLIAARQQVGRAMGTRAFRLGLGSGAAVLAVAALVVFLGAMAESHHMRWDLSQGHKLSLAPQSIKVIDKIENPVKIYAFFKAGQAGEQQVKELLDLYAYHSRKLSYQFVDLDNQPGLAKRFNVKTHGQLVMVGKDKEEKVSLPDEQKLTNALIRMTRTQKKTIYFLGGHGERDLKGIGQKDFSELKKSLENQSYEVKHLILATQVSVPDDAVCLILAAPAKNLLAVEKERIDAYLQKGGGVLMLIEPDHGSGLNDWLKERGVIIGDNLVVDASAARIGASPFWPLGLSYGSHKVVMPLENILTFFPIARTVTLAPKMPPGVIGVELVMTGPQSWAEVDFRGATEQPEFDEKRDLAGPVSLGVVVEMPRPAPKPEDKKDSAQKAGSEKAPVLGGRLIVFGDADFASNAYLEQAGNRDLALNSISFLAQEGDLISISPKQEASQPLMIQPSQARVIFWVPVVVLPVIFVIIGVVVVIRRRRPA